VIRLAHLTLILLLHYLVKFRSRSLVIYNNEFILGDVYDLLNNDKHGRRLAVYYYFSKSHTSYILSFSLQLVPKMFSASTNTSAVDVDATRQQRVQ